MARDTLRYFRSQGIHGTYRLVTSRFTRTGLPKKICEISDSANGDDLQVRGRWNLLVFFVIGSVLISVLLIW